MTEPNMQNITIRQKMMLFILGITIITYVITLGYVGYNMRENSIAEARKLADSYAAQTANDIKATINEDMAISRALSASLQHFIDYPRNIRDSLRRNTMVTILKKYPKYDAVWMSYELGAIDPSYKSPFGRERVNYYMRDGKVQSSTELANLNGDDKGSIYLEQKISRMEMMTEPYWYADYDYASATGDSILGVSPSVPIMHKGKFAGLIGTDMTVEDYQGMSEVSFLERGYAFLLSHEGLIIAHKKPALYSLPIQYLSFVKDKEVGIKDRIKQGLSFSFTTYDDELKEEVYISFAPISIGESNRPWTAGIVVPMSEITASFNKTFLITIIAGIIGFVLLSYITYGISKGITDSLDDTNELLTSLARGDLNPDHKLDIKGKDELSQMAYSVNFLMEELNKKADFANLIGRGDLEADFKSAGENDLLGNSLLTMRDNLRKVISDTQEVIVKAGEEGNLSAKINTESITGAWLDLSESINQLMASISSPIREVNRIVNAMEEGDLSQRFEVMATGDIANLSTNLNSALEKLGLLLADISENANVIDQANGEMLSASEEMTTNTGEIASAIAEMSSGA
ncbi:MAG: methyl-accepting chemotaxis protein, partial [Cyclobacteriaceae bacterium]